MLVAAQAVSAAFADYLAGGCDDAGTPAAMFGLAVGVLQDLGGTLRHLEVGEAVIAAERDRAVAEDRAVFPRPRHGLRALP